MEKPAPTERPIHDLIRRRWSPRAFSGKSVPRDLLATIFEAGRWSPSCYNDQPWSYLVATTDDPEDLARARGVLVDGNAWARSAPVLALSVARSGFAHNGKPNPHAWHDVGAASACILLEATHQGLFAHEMAGFDRERARIEYSVPEGWEPVAMIAIGYAGSDEALPEKQRTAETAPRSRKPLSEVLQGGRFGKTFTL